MKIFMEKIKLIIAYDGSGFSGWQVQPGARTVQEELQKGVSQLLGNPVHIAGSGRTDSGVHAAGQVAHFETEHCRVPVEKLPRVLRGCLPPDIQVRGAQRVPADFHARFSAINRVYRYRFRTRPLYPFERNRFAYFSADVQLQKLEQLLAVITGEHDFTTFSLKDSAGESRVRRIHRAVVEEQREGFDIVLEGNGFLRKMVRMIIGSIVSVYSEHDCTGKFKTMLEAEDNSKSGPPAPASGLYLERVDYPGEIC